MLLTTLGLHPHTTYAERYTRLNGNTLHKETKNKMINFGGLSYWEDGFELKKKGIYYHLKSWTVQNSKHVLHFRCVISKDGKISPRDSIVNGSPLGLGWMEMAQEYIDWFINELAEKAIVLSFWDEIAC